MSLRSHAPPIFLCTLSANILTLSSAPGSVSLLNTQMLEERMWGRELASCFLSLS